MHLSLVRKDTDFIRIFARKDMPVFRVCRLFISLIDRSIHNLCISEAVHQKDNILLLDLLCCNYSFFQIVNHGFALFAISFFKRGQFFDDYFCHGRTML